MRRILQTAPLLLLGLPALGGDSPTSPTPTATAPVPAAATPAPADATPAPVVVPAPPGPDAAMAAYEARKLKRKPLESTDPLYDATLRAQPGSPDLPWAVYHGDGTVLTASDFANGTGDTTTDARIRRAQGHAKIVQWTLTGAGVALVGLAVVPLLSMDRSIGDVGPEPQADAYPDLKAYTDAITVWRGDRGIEARNQNKVLTSFALGTTGILAIAASPFAPIGAKEREKVVPLYFSQSETDDRIIKYNIGVKKELGIIAPDPVDVVIPAAPPPPATPEDVDDGLEDGGGPPLKPSDAPLLQVQPWLGFGFLGVQGTF